MSEGYEERKYPEKSWSISRMKTLDSCQREYYYTTMEVIMDGFLIVQMNKR